jgi:hypothetical protein
MTMHYFALLLGPEPTEAPAPEDMAAEMSAYQSFHEHAASAIRAGDALTAAADGLRISGGPDAPVLTDGPFAEGAEVAGGYYVFEADNLDDALALAQQIPAARRGGVEVWPMVHWNAPTTSVRSDWLALLLESPADVHSPESAEFERGVAAHVEFGKAAGDHILAGAPLHPPTTATTVRVRDGKTILTDGPYVEGAEVANGFYLLRAADRDEAAKLASMIPATNVELRQLAGISSL